MTTKRHAARLSVNLNKIALLRNARDSGVPSVMEFARLALDAGAHGITVHPRPDGRHTRRSDVLDLAQLLRDWPGREFNVEGRPTSEFLELVEVVRPDQCTLVPDAPEAVTSDRGWDFEASRDSLALVVARLSHLGSRIILFADPTPHGLEWAQATGADGIEIYTGDYAAAFRSGDHVRALADVVATAERAAELGLIVNGGHDLNRKNLGPLLNTCVFAEFSIGHELAADALREGFSATVAAYLARLRTASLAWVA